MTPTPLTHVCKLSDKYICYNHHKKEEQEVCIGLCNKNTISYENFKYTRPLIRGMEDYLLIKILGDYPLIRILNHLLIFREFDYSLTDIAKESEVSWSTLHQLWPHLESKELVICTRNVGRAKMYKLNTKSKIVQNLMAFADALALDNQHEVEAE